MKEKILSIIGIMVFYSSVAAQDPAFYPIENNLIPSYISKIEKASASLTTLQSSFTQKKDIAILQESVVSKGTLIYKKDNKLCWEYTSPYYYLFVLNGDKVFIKNEKTTSQFDTKSNTLFKEISLLLVNSISGTGLIDPKKFDASFYESISSVQVRLIPKNKTLKSFLSTVILYFGKVSYLVNSIEMIEPSGDTNIIVFSEVKLNQPVDDQKFVVR
jgi:outer membrane lipoprotein carrier protein